MKKDKNNKNKNKKQNEVSINWFGLFITHAVVTAIVIFILNWIYPVINKSQILFTIVCAFVSVGMATYTAGCFMHFIDLKLKEKNNE